MSKTTRCVGFRSAGIELSLSDSRQGDDLAALGETAELPAPKPEDPARVAAAVMLGHALAASGTTFEEAGRDGTVTVVVVPDVEWTHPAMDEWRTAARWGEGYNEAGTARITARAFGRRLSFSTASSRMTMSLRPERASARSSSASNAARSGMPPSSARTMSSTALRPSRRLKPSEGW